MYSLLHIQINIFRSCYPHTEFIEIQGEIDNIKGPVNKVFQQIKLQAYKNATSSTASQSIYSVDGFLVEDLILFQKVTLQG